MSAAAHKIIGQQENRAAFGVMAEPHIINATALDVLDVAAAHIGDDSHIIWADRARALAILGNVISLDVTLPDNLSALDMLTMGAIQKAQQSQKPVRCRIGRLFEVRVDMAQKTVTIRRLGQGAADRRAVDKEAQDIARAIESRRMQLFLQPIIETHTGTVQRLECLARLFTVDGAIISPAVFIPIAERAGLIGDLDLATLDIALPIMQHSAAISLAVNVSAATVADEKARNAYLDRLALSPVKAGQLTVEITETIAIEDLDVAANFAGRVRALGCRVALDDFGQGHTSFRSLLKLPLDEVKIDGLYVESIDERAQSRAFVRAIDQLSRELGLETVAERVETEAEAQALRALGVGALQGYHFGRPEPA